MDRNNQFNQTNKVDQADKVVGLQRLKESGLVAVIRKPNASQIEQIAQALVAGGVGALEITVETPGAIEMIEQLKSTYSTKVLVGAGTVLDAQQAEKALKAGADFIFSPSYDEQTIKMTNQYGKISIPGVMTPTEIVKAYKAGADIVKIFPASSLGVNYIKELQGPLGHIPMMPTGGVNLDNVEAFIRHGAVAVGAGGSLLNSQAIVEERYEELTQIAQQFISKIKQART
jgi:2-dehydro-3-deoxyphosphogluconate aldolase/(4S)-4-hydroxy-2-oxoglutarate aldolase